MKRKAFTMLELILVIVITGILAAIAIPRIERNSLIECADQVINHIRYTQHLAIDDHKFNSNDPDWYRKYWRIVFHNFTTGADGWRYTIFQDIAPGLGGNPNAVNELAKDPVASNRWLTSGFANESFNNQESKLNKKLNLRDRYDVQNITFAGGCAGTHTIAFDENGRPLAGNVSGSNMPYDRVMNQDCRITIENGSGQNVIITIYAESGFVELDKVNSTALQN